jgi:hypothetical protein
MLALLDVISQRGERLPALRRSTGGFELKPALEHSIIMKCVGAHLNADGIWGLAAVHEEIAYRYLLPRRDGELVPSHLIPHPVPHSTRNVSGLCVGSVADSHADCMSLHQQVFEWHNPSCCKIECFPQQRESGRLRQPDICLRLEGLTERSGRNSIRIIVGSTPCSTKVASLHLPMLVVTLQISV